MNYTKVEGHINFQITLNERKVFLIDTANYLRIKYLFIQKKKMLTKNRKSKNPHYDWYIFKTNNPCKKKKPSVIKRK